MSFIGTRFRNNVNDAAGCSAKLGGRPSGHHLKLFHRIQRDIDRGALAAELLAKESVVVIAAVETDVVEDAALSGKCDFVSVRALDDDDPGRQGKQVYEFSSKNRRLIYG